jgi:hypothetical protein
MDSIPVKKKRPEPVQPVQSVHPKKKVAHQPTHPTDTTQIKKKYRLPTQRVSPVRKHKTPPVPKTSQPVKEPPIS